MPLKIAEGKANILTTFFTVLLYGLFMYCLQLFLFKCLFFPNIPGTDTLLRFDALSYFDLANNGYTPTLPAHIYQDHSFLFPWIWRIFSVKAFTMSSINLVIYAIGFSLLTSGYKLQTEEKLVWLSLPSMLFMVVPYSEASYFLWDSLCLFALANNNKVLTYVSLVLLPLAGVQAIYLLPGLVIMEVVKNDRQDTLKSILKSLLHYGLPLIIGMLVFASLRASQSGNCFLNFNFIGDSSAIKWGLPKFPFTNSTGSERIAWLSGIALFAGLASLVLLVRQIVQWSRTGKPTEESISIISLAYLPCLLFVFLFHNDTGNSHTDLAGLHRLMMCSPFFFVFLYNYVLKGRSYSNKHILVVCLLSNVVWLAMGAFVHITYIMYFNVASLMIVLYMVQAKKSTTWATMVICIINITLQTILYQQYLSGVIVD